MRVHVKYPLFLSDFDETWIFSTNFEKYSNIKFHENPSGGSRVVPCGRTDGRTDKQTDLMRLAVAENKIVDTTDYFANIIAKYKKPRMVRMLEEIWCRVRIYYFNILAISKTVARLKQNSRSSNDVKNRVKSLASNVSKQLQGNLERCEFLLG